jgi:membrane-associated phospholipid phosphatase
VRRLRPDTTGLAAFPSGHTSASFSLATVAASKWGWKVGVPACLLVGFVGYTRMESNKHYLSDVLFGAGVGIVSGRAVYTVRRHAHPDRYAFAPFVSPSGGGVTVFF